MWDLSPLSRDQTHVPCIGRQILNHWTTREAWHHMKYLPKVTKLQSDRTEFNLTLLYYTPGASQRVLSSVQSLIRVWLFATPWTAAHQASLSITNSWSLLKLITIELVMSSNYLILPFSSCLQSFPTSGSFPMNQFLISGGQSIGALAWASVLPMNIQGWFLLGLTGLISILVLDKTWESLGWQGN